MKFLFKALVLLLLLGGMLAAFLYWQQYQNFLKQPLDLPQQELIFSVEKGSTFRNVATELEKQGIISSALDFRILAKLQKQENKLKAGEYQLDNGMTPPKLLEVLTSGRSLQYKHTIIEGKTFKEIIASIKNNPDLKQTLSDDDYAQLMQQLASKYANPEGLFFPDTYNFPKGTTDLQFLQRSHKDMLSYLREAWDKRDPQATIKTPYEALILASIVEKETGHEAERPMIARVFLNRLEKGMMLQTDPTVIYGMGDKYDGNIRKRDLQTDTPYNTYTRYGLPPTPIAIPGRKAIDAVMHPPDGKALYFVAKGDGTSYFSNSYNEHRKAVVKYQLNGNASRYTGNN